MIDVERMLMSPIAMKEKWRDKANSAEGQMLHFPINAGALHARVEARLRRRISMTCGTLP